jgi:hypothetical protein
MAKKSSINVKFIIRDYTEGEIDETAQNHRVDHTDLLWVKDLCFLCRRWNRCPL